MDDLVKKAGAACIDTREASDIPATLEATLTADELTALREMTLLDILASITIGDLLDLAAMKGKP